jgi:hypothetical protein
MQIKVRCVRPMMHNGERVEADTILDLDPLAAGAAIDSSRAELVDANDAARVDAAVAEHTAQVLRKLGAGEAQAAATFALRRRRA